MICDTIICNTSAAQDVEVKLNSATIIILNKKDTSFSATIFTVRNLMGTQHTFAARDAFPHIMSKKPKQFSKRNNHELIHLLQMRHPLQDQAASGGASKARA